MNESRRKELEKASKLIQDAQIVIQKARDDEQEAFDNLSEGLQSGDKGDHMQEIVASLDSANDSCEEAVSNIEEARG